MMAARGGGGEGGGIASYEVGGFVKRAVIKIIHNKVSSFQKQLHHKRSFW